MRSLLCDTNYINYDLIGHQFLTIQNMNHPHIAALVTSEKSARKRKRYLALPHFIEGHSRTTIASMLKVSRTSVNRWVTAYLTMG